MEDLQGRVFMKSIIDESVNEIECPQEVTIRLYYLNLFGQVGWGEENDLNIDFFEQENIEKLQAYLEEEIEKKATIDKEILYQRELNKNENKILKNYK